MDFLCIELFRKENFRLKSGGEVGNERTSSFGVKNISSSTLDSQPVKFSGSETKKGVSVIRLFF